MAEFGKRIKVIEIKTRPRKPERLVPIKIPKRVKRKKKVDQDA